MRSAVASDADVPGATARAAVALPRVARPTRHMDLSPRPAAGHRRGGGQAGRETLLLGWAVQPPSPGSSSVRASWRKSVALTSKGRAGRGSSGPPMPHCPGPATERRLEPRRPRALEVGGARGHQHRLLRSGTQELGGPAGGPGVRLVAAAQLGLPAQPSATTSRRSRENRSRISTSPPISTPSAAGSDWPRPARTVAPEPRRQALERRIAVERRHDGVEQHQINWPGAARVQDGPSADRGAPGRSEGAAGAFGH